ncbi:MAG: polymer-forming cytoskeletal protein [bacterium]|nr:polymer-forming cytoskeletal protein [bacterium]
MLTRGGTTSTGTEIATVIGAETLIEGNITVPHSMRLDGRVHGQVNVTETLTVGPNGTVEGNVQVKSVIVGGKVIGSVSASDKITLNSTAAMNGDLVCAKLVIEEGAVFEGMSRMGTGKLPLMMPQAEPRSDATKPNTSEGAQQPEVPRWADRKR